LDNQETTQPDGEQKQEQQDESKQPTDVVSRDEFKQVIQQRDEVKKKLREIEEAEAKKRGDFEALLNQAKAELDEKSKALEEAMSYKEKYTAIEKQRKEELLSQLSDEHRRIAEMLPIDALPEYVKLNGKQAPPASSGMRTGKANVTHSIS